MKVVVCSAPQLIPSLYCGPASTTSDTISLSFCSHPKLCGRHPNRLSSRSLTLENTNANTEGSTSEKSLSVSSDTPSRRLILLRHAKSSWDDRSFRDHDRRLSASGRADAAAVAVKLKNMGWVPELILSSDATRTRETLSIMQDQVRCFLEAEIHFVSSFYSIAALDGHTAEHIQQIVCKLSRDDTFTVMCMGHNRGWEEAASVFTGTSIELKACNAALLESHGRSWEEAFALAGLGGWQLTGLVKPNGSQ